MIGITPVRGRRVVKIVDEFHRYEAEVSIEELTSGMSVAALHDFIAPALRAAVARDESDRRALAASTRKRIRERDGNRCRYCGSEGDRYRGPDRKPWHVDHIHPLAAGGSDSDDNLALACSTCNLKKSDYLDVLPMDQRDHVIPTVSELVPAARLAELEAEFE